MGQGNFRGAVVACLVSLPMVDQASGADKTPPRPLQAAKLYLNVGTIDTRSAQNGPDLLWHRPKSYAAGKAYVLQMDGPITPQRRAALVEAGVKLGDYLPLNAYIVDLSGVRPQTIDDLPFVSWIGAYRNEWKLSPTIGRRPAPGQATEPTAPAEQGWLRLTVILFQGCDLQEGKQSLARAGATVLGGYMMGGQGHVAVTVDTEQLVRLAELPQVQFVEEAPRITYRNYTTRWIVQSNVADLTPLYDNGIHGEGQIAGVIDTRPDQHHCSLDDGKILYYNASDGNHYHGTHVSCSIVGDDTSDANLQGVAYLGYMVFHIIPSYDESSIMQRLELHHSQGARVHTNSWGDDTTTDYNSLCRGFDRFCYENEDDLACVAETNATQLKNPENAKNILAVAASQDTPNQYNHCSGGTGPTADDRRKPEIYAPGCATMSAAPSACDTQARTGTSMACPAVAGVGMLVRQYFMDGYYPTGSPDPGAKFTNPSGALLKATLLNSAVDMTGISGYPSDLEGWGRVLADDALYFPGDSRKLVVLEDLRNADGLSTGREVQYRITVQGTGEKLKVTLVWTDPPASASTGSGFAAVNDLDLEVESPGGEVYKGNVFSDGVSVTGGSKDDRNNVEQVHLDSPELGIWRVRLWAAAVNEGTQGFALVATGDAAETVLDYAVFHDCMAGPTVLPSPTPPRTSGDCLDDFDFDRDDDVDLADFNAWMKGFTSDECEVDGDCDDSVACTDDACVAGSCVFTPNDANCPDDGLYCNGPEFCDAALDCSSTGDPCLPGEFCNETTNTCDECQVDGDCDDSVACTDDTCVAGSCVFTPNDAHCDDGLYCNGAETCDALLDCQAGTAVDCDDAVGCTDDSCNEGTDSCDNVPNDSLCDDGLYCNGAETCDALLDCQAGAAVDCDDTVGCTDDSCNEGTDSCDNVANDANCNDGLYCNGAETCDALLDCQAGTAVDCDDTVGCTDDSCNEGTDSCDNVPNHANCDDSLYCNGAETCDALLDCQTGMPVGCSDGVVCTDDSCNEDTDSCDSVPNDSLCDDGLYCNGGETCHAVLDCQSGTAVDCDDTVGCTDDSCNEGTDSCDNVPNDGLCDDGLYCNGAETCDPQLDCQAGTAVDCSDGVGCTDDSCNEGTDSCDNVPNDANCPDDGLYCNGTEFCDAALDCSSTGDPCLPSGFCNETTDTCDECQVDGDCDDIVACTDDTCVGGSCVFTPNDANCPDDGLYCNGAEFCDAALDCSSTGDPCLPSEFCYEATDTCETSGCPFTDDFDRPDSLTVGNNWVETEGYLGSDVSIEGDFPTTGNGYCRLYKHTAAITQSGIDTTGRTNIVFSYNWRAAGSSVFSDKLNVEWKLNAGGTWNLLAEHGLDQTSFQFASHNLPPAAENTLIDIRFTLSSGGGGKAAHVDHVGLCGD